MNLCKCGCGTLVNKTWAPGHNRQGTTFINHKVYDKQYIIEKFKTKYEINVENGCWEWKGKLVQGYGGMYCCWEGKGKSYPAHRLSYMINVGDIPDGLQILHKCNNKKCVNPDHIYAGTHTDNMDDLREAGTLAGKNNPNYGVKCSDERKEKISRGVKKWIKNNPEFNSGDFANNSWKITKPSGEEVIIENLSRYCRDNDLKFSSNYQGLYILNKNWKSERI